MDGTRRWKRNKLYVRSFDSPLSASTQTAGPWIWIVESHLQTQRSAVSMLHERILLLVKYVGDVVAGMRGFIMRSFGRVTDRDVQGPQRRIMIFYVPLRHLSHRYLPPRTRPSARNSRPYATLASFHVCQLANEYVPGIRRCSADGLPLQPYQVDEYTQRRKILTLCGS